VSGVHLFVRRLPPGAASCGGRSSRASHLESLRFEAADSPTGPARLRDDDLPRSKVALHGRCVRSRRGRGVRRRAPARGPCPASEASCRDLLLNQVTFPSAIASKAARCRWRGRKGRPHRVGFRRTHGLDAGWPPPVGGAGRVQCDEQRGGLPPFGIPPAGTMAHSYIERSRANSRRFAPMGGFPR